MKAYRLCCFLRIGTMQRGAIDAPSANEYNRNQNSAKSTANRAMAKAAMLGTMTATPEAKATAATQSKGRSEACVNFGLLSSLFAITNDGGW